MSGRVVIVGSGICGLFCAMELAKSGCEVSVFEQDEPPPDGDVDQIFYQWSRRGAAQFKHPHAFLGLMCSILEQHHPELLDHFYRAGARRVNFPDSLPLAIKANYHAEPEDDKIWLLLCRRATMEWVLRRYVEALPNVHIRSSCRVVGVCVEEGAGSHSRKNSIPLKGVQILGDEGSFEEHADLVIDASGRMSGFPRWLAELGVNVREENLDAEIVYYTRHYTLREGQKEPPRSDKAGAGDMGYLKFGVFPGDNGSFAIIICLPTCEQQLAQAVRTGILFDRICQNIPGLAPWVQEGRSRATTEPFGMGDIQSVWRSYGGSVGARVQARVQATNFFAVGDAVIRTNPLYGRGCSTGLLHVRILASVLKMESDPVKRAKLFEEKTQTLLRPIYNASVSEDKRGIRRARLAFEGKEVDRTISLGRWVRLSLSDAISAAARGNVSVFRGVMKTFHLLERPGTFLKDWRVLPVIVRYLFRGRKRNAAARLQPGPSREAMHQLLGLDTTSAAVRAVD